MGKNKTGKYFKYAIGEIILVVIGILIALQINNWNETRKYKSLEIATLEEIQKGIDQALTENKRTEDANMETIVSYDNILKHFEQNLPYNKSLNRDFWRLLSWQEPDFNYAGFELFKSRGADLISNDSIKLKLLNIYEEKIQYLVNDHNKTEWNYNNTIMTPFFTDNFEISMKDYSAIPNNYNQLMKNQEFKNKLTYLTFIRKFGILLSNELRLLLENINMDISNEINRLETK